MATTSTGRSTAPAPTAWVGWLVFAGLMLITVGAFNAIDGLVALFKDEVFVATDEQLIAFDLTQWGWVHLTIGILQVLVGLAVFTGATWAHMVAVGLVILNAIGQLAFLNAYPFWSTIVIALDVVILWALVVHGDETRTI
jgi:hypothetical protein